jgi:YD repeat-containing protein
VAEAFSGPLARGLADTEDRPYKMYYQYDAMGHLTGRVGSELWDAPGTMFPDTDTYVNNRNTSWQYDADGRITNGDGIQYTYDAAGRAVTVTSGGDHTQTQSFDGDGIRAKIVDEQYIDDGSGTTSLEMTTRYFVTSSVLGAVVTELDEAGQKGRGYVYGSGELLAWQVKEDGFEEVIWEHRDPSDASFRMTALSSALDYSRSAELDPLGADAGVRSPFSIPGPPRPPEERQDLTYPGFADLLSGNCKIDGIPAPSAMCSRMLRAGAGYRAPSSKVTTMRFRNGNNQVKYALAVWSVTGFGAGYLPVGASFDGSAWRVTLGFNEFGEQVGRGRGVYLPDSTMLPSLLQHELAHLSPQNSQLAPLPADQNAAIDSAYHNLLFRLNFGQISDDCRGNVIDKLTANGFDLSEFVRYLSGPVEFYNGLTSQAPAAGTVHPQRTANLLWGARATIADIFNSPTNNRRTIALTSITSSTLLVFFNPTYISTDNGGVNGRNLGLLFHEALHGFGARSNSFYDQDLMRIFNLSGASNELSSYIQRHCFN